MADLDTTRSGIDRRTLIKRSAAAGAVAWVAPTVLATPAHAVDFIPGTTCTLKCVPVVNDQSGRPFAVGSATIEPCLPGPPGLQRVRVTVNSFEPLPGAGCPCGGDPVVEVGDQDIVGQTFTLARPGTQTIEFEVDLTTTCIDRSGDRISITCVTQAASNASGNCNSLGGRTIALQFVTIRCLAPACSEAEA